MRISHPSAPCKPTARLARRDARHSPAAGLHLDGRARAADGGHLRRLGTDGPAATTTASAPCVRRFGRRSGAEGVRAEVFGQGRVVVLELFQRAKANAVRRAGSPPLRSLPLLELAQQQAGAQPRMHQARRMEERAVGTWEMNGQHRRARPAHERADVRAPGADSSTPPAGLPVGDLARLGRRPSEPPARRCRMRTLPPSAPGSAACCLLPPNGSTANDPVPRISATVIEQAVRHHAAGQAAA